MDSADKLATKSDWSASHDIPMTSARPYLTCPVEGEKRV